MPAAKEVRSIRKDCRESVEKCAFVVGNNNSWNELIAVHKALKLAENPLVYSLTLRAYKGEANTEGFACWSDACEVEKWHIIEIRSIRRIDKKNLRVVVCKRDPFEIGKEQSI